MITWDISLGDFLGDIFVGIATLFTSFTALRIANRNQKQFDDYVKIRELIEQFELIEKISIKYPILTNKQLTFNYNSYDDYITIMRYENFCRLLYSFLYKLYLYNNHNEKEMLNFLNFYPFIYLHHDWFEKNLDILENYCNKDFIDFIQLVFNNILKSNKDY